MFDLGGTEDREAMETFVAEWRLVEEDKVWVEEVPEIEVARPPSLEESLGRFGALDLEGFVLPLTVVSLFLLIDASCGGGSGNAVV